MPTDQDLHSAVPKMQCEIVTLSPFADFVSDVKAKWKQESNRSVSEDATAALDSLREVETEIEFVKMFDHFDQPSNHLLLSSKLPWREFCSSENGNSQARICRLTSSDGNKCFAISEKMTLSLLLLPAKTKLTQHAEEAEVILQVLAGGGSKAMIGYTEDHLESVQNGKVLHFASTVTRAIKAGDDCPLLLLYARFGYLGSGGDGGNVWFSEAENDNAFVDEYKSYHDVRSYYSRMAKSYTRLHRGWGWCLPDVGADAVLRCVGNIDVKVLDLGTGDGLTGLALKKRGFVDITGVDFSEAMLEEADRRGCYRQLKLADLMLPLPFAEGIFDVVICTGVTSMLDFSIFAHWICVTKPGGILVFSIKTIIWPKYEAEIERLEKKEKVWRLEYASEMVPNLPSLKEQRILVHTDMVRIYVYRKL